MTGRRRDRGVVATEMAVAMVAVFAGFLMLVVYAGRVGQAGNDVRIAAQAAARAASVEQTAVAATEAARTVASANLARSGVACAEGQTVKVDTSRFGPGGEVAVTVTCHHSHLA